MLNAVPVRQGARRIAVRPAAAQLPMVDPWLLFAGLLLLTLGLVMVASASMPIADSQANQPFYYLIRQVIYSGVGLILGLVAFQVPLEVWRRRGPVLLMAAIGLLMLVLIPGIGKEVNGSMRWIDIKLISVQISEPAKLFTLIYMAGYLQRHDHR